MKKKQQSDLSVLLGYAGNYRGLTFLGLALSAVAMILGMAPYLCVWLVVRELIAVAPNWAQAAEISRYGWMAFAFAVSGIVVYFCALMCTHLAAFRTASNIRKQGIAHLMQTPLGWFDNNASGLIRNRLDGASADTETLLAHNLADIVGTAAMFLAMLALMLVFDWRMGAACLLTAVVSVSAMASMMTGRNAGLMAEYQAAQDVMSKAGTEYVRGIPVVKVFQQTVYSFKAFRDAIEDYSAKAEHYQADVCRVPQAVNLTFTEGAFVFLVPVALLLAPRAGVGQFCRVSDGFCVLRGVLRHHLHGACQNHVRRQRYDAGRHGAGTHRAGHECADAEGGGASAPAAGQPRGVQGRVIYIRRRRAARAEPRVLPGGAGADRGAGRPLGRRQDHGGQPDPALLGRQLRSGGGRRRGRAAAGSPRADGSGGLRVPEHASVQGLDPGKRARRAAGRVKRRRAGSALRRAV